MTAEVSIKLDKINLIILKIMKFLETWLMVFELLELSGLNKMCFIINNYTVYYLANTVTGCLK